VVLKGHNDPVTLLAFSEEMPSLLCSVSQDAVIIWNVSECLGQNTGRQSSLVPSHNQAQFNQNHRNITQTVIL